MPGSPEWIHPLRRPCGPYTTRLVVFPYAAAGPSSLRPLLTRLPETVELLGVALPGRERRFGEPPETTSAEIVRGVADALAGRPDLPTHLLGHSMGAGLAAALALADPGACEGLILSGRPPGSVAHDTLQGLCDEEIVGFLSQVGNTRPELVRDPFWRDRVLRLFRSDTALDVRTVGLLTGMLRERVLVLGGAEDPYVDVSALAGWADRTTGPCEVRVFPGGHFFLLDEAVRQEVVDVLAGFLSGEHARPGAPAPAELVS
ncbi:alpha/beta fold hydrolase [Streptomyces sp. NPDC052052]|uniref:thioesterase II family protein n=1 Tax=Streptomyces sp. NPDC052052 TaxID=3154756 RepID=UPI003420A207